MKMLNNKGPKIDPCGTKTIYTPRIIFVIYFYFLFSI